jgi:hypothetical protein
MSAIDEHPDRARIEAAYAAAVALRRVADPLLAGQIEGIIGRLSALLASIGAPVPDDALPQKEEGGS